MTTTQPGGVTRRRYRAAIIGLAFDGRDLHKRVSTGEQCLLVGGSTETHSAMLETMLRLESELDRLGVGLGELAPEELAEIGWRIDSPELVEIALRIESGLESRGITFEEATPEDLTELSAPGLI